MTIERLTLILRVLAVAALAAIALAVLEGVEVRRLRHEVQQLRDERARVQARAENVWVQQAGDDFAEATRWLHAFYAEPTQGLGRPGGLCPGGNIDADAINRWVLQVFVTSRAAGGSMGTSMNAMAEAVQASSDWRRVHPGK